MGLSRQDAGKGFVGFWLKVTNKITFSVLEILDVGHRVQKRDRRITFVVVVELIVAFSISLYNRRILCQCTTQESNCFSG